MAVLTPTVVQKSTEQVQNAITGTPVKVTTFKLKATKAAQNDTIVVPTALGDAYTTDKVVGFYGIVIPSGGDAVAETVTIDDSDDEIVLGSATVGTAWITIELTE